LFSFLLKNPITKNDFGMQMVLKATDQRGKVPWQETLIPSDNPNWQVCHNTPVNTLHKPVEFSGELCYDTL